MGFPEIATNLYMKSLELCVDIDKEWKSKVILVKMKRSFMASALASHEQRPMSDITTLIDKWHVLENFEKYNDLMMKFTNFTNLLYSPFEYFTKGRQKFTKYLELPENMRDEWTCVKIYDDEDSPDVLLVGFQDEVGLVGFQVSTDRIFDGVPENYVITIKKGAQIKFIKPKPDNEEHLLCRAIAVIRNEKRDIDIDRRIPVFFKQLKI